PAVLDWSGGGSPRRFQPALYVLHGSWSVSSRFLNREGNWYFRGGDMPAAIRSRAVPESSLVAFYWTKKQLCLIHPSYFPDELRGLTSQIAEDPFSLRRPVTLPDAV